MNHDSPGSQHRGLDKLIRGLLGLLSAGVVTTAWILYFTDWFLVVGGLLTLSGSFAWIALISGLLSEQSRKRLQWCFERRVLAASWFQRGSVAWIILLGLVSLFTTSVSVDTFRDDQHRSVAIRVRSADGSSKDVREAALPARSSTRFLFFGIGPIEVKLSGLPEVEFDLPLFRPFERLELSSPRDFVRRTVILVRPCFSLSQYAHGKSTEGRPLRLKVETAKSEVLVGPMDFHGQAVWVGTEGDVEIPDAIRQRWVADLACGGGETGLNSPATPQDLARWNQWMPPVAPRLIPSIEERQMMVVKLLNPNGSEFREPVRYEVRPRESSASWVQEIVLRSPT